MQISFSPGILHCILDKVEHAVSHSNAEFRALSNDEMMWNLVVNRLPKLLNKFKSNYVALKLPLMILPES